MLYNIIKWGVTEKGERILRLCTSFPDSRYGRASCKMINKREIVKEGETMKKKEVK